MQARIFTSTSIDAIPPEDKFKALQFPECDDSAAHTLKLICDTILYSLRTREAVFRLCLSCTRVHWNMGPIRRGAAWAHNSQIGPASKLKLVCTR